MNKKSGDATFNIRLINNEKETLIDVEARDKESVLTALAVFVKELKEHGNIEEEKLRYAFELGLGNKEHIQVKKIKVTKENEDAVKELLKKLSKED